MKHIRPKFVLMVLVVFLLSISMNYNESYLNNVYAENKPMRGVWVSTVSGLDFPSEATTDAGELKSEIKEIVKECKQIGFNTIFLQVRPCADSLYNSVVFPWSRYLTGKSGLAPSGNFDPLKYWVEICHENSMEVHAWINPYRITKLSDAEFSQLSADHPAVLNPQWVVKYSDGNYYFNPGIPEVHDLVYKGAAEILQNYDVDGIHLDDYFYPGKDFDDELTFQQYKGNFTDKGDWRRNNVDELIKSLHNLSRISGVEFGVSPIGIWDNLKTNSLGSNTNGRSSYSELFADSRGWVKKGYVDYIIPQVYWEFGHALADYETVTKWWIDVCKDTDVKLYIGIADYKSVDVDSSSSWFGGGQILKQLEFNSQHPEISGEVHFRSKLIIDNDYLRNTILDFYQDSVDNQESLKPDSNLIQDSGTKGDIRVFVNGKKVSFDTPPVVFDERVLVPMRAIFEALEAKVSWNQSSNTATVRKDGVEMTFTPNSYMFNIGEERYLFDVTAKVINERIFIPLRSVSEVMGYEVQWDGNENTVIINE